MKFFKWVFKKTTLSRPTISKACISFSAYTQCTQNHAIRSHLCLAVGLHIQRDINSEYFFFCLYVFQSLFPSFSPSICCCSSETNYGEYCAVTDCYTCTEITGDTIDSGKQVCLFFVHGLYCILFPEHANWLWKAKLDQIIYHLSLLDLCEELEDLKIYGYNAKI